MPIVKSRVVRPVEPDVIRKVTLYIDYGRLGIEAILLVNAGAEKRECDELLKLEGIRELL